MQDTTYSKTVAVATNFFAIAKAWPLYLFPCAAGTKRPILPWKDGSTADAKQCAAWDAEGFNMAIDCAKSGLLMLDIDASKVTREEAWGAYHKLCLSWGLASAPAAMTHTARGGWHVPFQRPEGIAATDLRGGGTLVKISDIRDLAPGEANGEVIGFKNRGYCVAPDSLLTTSEGDLPYLLASDAPAAPQECPARLLELIRLRVIEATYTGEGGTSDKADVAKLVAELDMFGEFSVEPDWFKYMGAIKLALGDTEEGVEVALQMTQDDATEEAFWSRWKRLASVDDGGNRCRIGSMIRRYAELTGKKFHVGKSSAAMFRDVPQIASESIAPTLPAGAVSMLGGPRMQIVAPDYGETEITERFVANYGKQLSYIKSRKQWLYWDGRRWRADETGYVADLARKHCQAEAALAHGTRGYTDANVRSFCSDRMRKAVLSLASDDQRIATKADDWDSDPWLLGTPDMVVELRTSTLRAARPEDRVTKSTGVTPSGDCPTWLKFLATAAGGNVELQAYLQRFCGYALTGDTSEESLHFNHGPGGGGKGTYMHAIEGILGDYHVSTGIATLTEAKQDRHLAELAALKGARLVTCSETERGKRWAESRIKELTGRDTITARYMHGNPFNFVPTFKLLISGNYKPQLRPDSAMRRRFQLVPFTAKIPESEKDTNLGTKLRAEWPGILAWMIAGCAMWQRDGLSPPATVVEATDEYMNEEAEDCLAAWLAERCDTDPKVETPSAVLYSSYKRYAELSSEKPITNVEFGKELRRLHYKVRKGMRGALVTGLKLAPQPYEPSQRNAADMFAGIAQPPAFPYAVQGGKS